jgi:hypothetical protein
MGINMDEVNTIDFNKYYLKNYHEITEKDFYPPEDTRLYNSGIDDINDGDNFDDYSKWFYDNYEYELFDS